MRREIRRVPPSPENPRYTEDNGHLAKSRWLLRVDGRPGAMKRTVQQWLKALALCEMDAGAPKPTEATTAE